MDLITQHTQTQTRDVEATSLNLSVQNFSGFQFPPFFSRHCSFLRFLKSTFLSPISDLRKVHPEVVSKPRAFSLRFSSLFFCGSSSLLAQMEALYSKLYDKYTKIKTQKESEMDKLNHDQEVKFMKYVTAADELIEHLRNENRRLHEQTNNLRSEAASIRSSTDEQKAEYQKLLKEEKQKNNQLSEEIERLRYLQLEGLCCSAREGNTENGQLNMSRRSQVGSGILNGSDVNVTRKRRRHYGTSADITVAPYSGDQLEHAPGRESASDLSKKTLSGGTDPVVDQPECESASDLSKKTLSRGTDSVVDQAECCRGKINLSGGESNDTGPTNCIFHDLIEFLVSMKLSTIPRNDGRSISAVHQSSGYSFSLTFVNSKAGEVELLYRVLSLGTFERVAPEWMKEEVLRFSTRMCPVFFQRVSHVIKRYR